MKSYVKPGESLSAISAEVYNVMVDLSRVMRLYHLSSGRRGFPPGYEVVWVRNNSGGDVDAWNVLGLDDLVWGGAELKARRAMKGMTPSSSYRAKFCVTLEPIPSGRAGLAAISGVVPVRVSLNAAGDATHCDVGTSTGALVSSPFGSAQIMAREGLSDPGAQWALVRLGADPHIVHLVKVISVNTVEKSCAVKLVNTDGGAVTGDAYTCFYLPADAAPSVNDYGLMVSRDRSRFFFKRSVSGLLIGWAMEEFGDTESVVIIGSKTIYAQVSHLSDQNGLQQAQMAVYKLIYPVSLWDKNWALTIKSTGGLTASFRANAATTDNFGTEGTVHLYLIHEDFTPATLTWVEFQTLSKTEISTSPYGRPLSVTVESTSRLGAGERLAPQSSGLGGAWYGYSGLAEDFYGLAIVPRTNWLDATSACSDYIYRVELGIDSQEIRLFYEQ